MWATRCTSVGGQKLIVPTGWPWDAETSGNLKANVLVPNGKMFARAEAVMYSRAFTPAEKKNTRTVQSFIDGAINQMKANQNGRQVAKSTPLKTKSGQQLVTFAFTVKGSSYERIAYGKEGDYWIMFVIGSKSEAGLKRNLPTFQKMVATYK